MWDYSEKVKEHFFHPRNVGEIEDANAIGEVGSIACGDALKLYLKVGEDERIDDVRFQTFGCGSAIASSSALTEMIKGRTLNEASSVTNQDIARYLDGLPEEKMHCSVMGMEALEAAIANYRGIEIEEDHEDEGVLICKCYGVTDEKIKRTVRENNLHTIDEVTHYCKAGGGCTSCHPEIEDMIHDVWNEPKDARPTAPFPAEAPSIAVSTAPAPGGGMTNLQRIARIQETIAAEIAPALRADGGDLELIDVDGHTVKVHLQGACSSCPSSSMTLHQFVENRLIEALGDPELKVEEV